MTTVSRGVIFFCRKSVLWCPAQMCWWAGGKVFLSVKCFHSPSVFTVAGWVCFLSASYTHLTYYTPDTNPFFCHVPHDARILEWSLSHYCLNVSIMLVHCRPMPWIWITLHRVEEERERCVTRHGMQWEGGINPFSLKEGKREKVKGQEQTVTRQVQKGAVREEANEPQAPL